MTLGLWEVPAGINDLRVSDSPRLQEAVDRAKLAGGGIVHLGPGTFVLDDDIALDSADLLVRGSGPATKIRNRAAAEFAFLVTGTRCGVEDLMIDCESVGEGGIHFTTGATRPHARNLTIAGSVDEAVKGSGTVAANGLLDNIYIPDGAVGIEFANGFTGMRVSGGLNLATRPFNLGTGAGHIVSGQGGGLLYKDTQLTHAQIGALRATPITVVPSPGAGYALMPYSIHLAFDVTTTAYSESADNIALEYAGGADCLVIETTGFLDQTSDQFRFQSMAEAVFTPVAAEALQLFNNGDGEFGSGNAANTLSVRVYYVIVPMAAFKSN